MVPLRTELYDARRTVTLARMTPEFIARMSAVLDPVLRQDGICQDERRLTRFARLTEASAMADVIQELWPFCESPQGLICMGFRAAPPGLETLTRYLGDAKKPILGLHVDFLEPGTEPVRDGRVRALHKCGADFAELPLRKPKL